MHAANTAACLGAQADTDAWLDAREKTLEGQIDEHKGKQPASDGSDSDEKLVQDWNIKAQSIDLDLQETTDKKVLAAECRPIVSRISNAKEAVSYLARELERADYFHLEQSEMYHEQLQTKKQQRLETVEAVEEQQLKTEIDELIGTMASNKADADAIYGVHFTQTQKLEAAQDELSSLRKKNGFEWVRMDAEFRAAFQAQFPNETFPNGNGMSATVAVVRGVALAVMDAEVRALRPPCRARVHTKIWHCSGGARNTPSHTQAQ